MAINFPSSPSLNETFSDGTNYWRWVGTKWVKVYQGYVTSSNVAPSAPSEGQFWFNTDSAALMVYYSDSTSNQWVDVGGGAISFDQYARVLSDTSSLILPIGNTAQRPSSGLARGQIRFNTDIEELELYNYTWANVSVNTFTRSAANIVAIPGTTVSADSFTVNNYISIGDSISVGGGANTAADFGLLTDALSVPVGNTFQRPSSTINGMLRYNTTTSNLEAVIGGSWIRIAYGDPIYPTPASSYGERIFNNPGTYSWTAPAGVTSVCVVCVGGGAGGGGATSGGSGGGGGALAWANDIQVTPGNSYTVEVGAASFGVATGTAARGGNSYFISDTVCLAEGGYGGTAGALLNGGLGGNYYPFGGMGGAGGASTSASGGGGGGGAGGYAGAGGVGGTASNTSATSGTGGAAGGGLGSSTASGSAGSGGGVGIYGQGANGAAGGGGGSDGLSAQNFVGGTYGGGGNASDANIPGRGGHGVVRIIWGPYRAFPSSNVGYIY